MTKNDWNAICGDLVKSVASSKKIHLHLSAKLSDPSTSVKLHWSIHKTFVNAKKVLLISPLLINGKRFKSVLEKVDIFNDFLASNASQDQKLAFFHQCLYISQITK